MSRGLLIAQEMQRMLNDSYAKMGQLIQGFETKCGSRDATRPSVEG